MTEPTALAALRERAKGPAHEALHTLGPRIPDLNVGDCHCNLLIEVALDAMMPVITSEAARLTAELAEARARGERWRRLAVDLTRCSHGRVQGDTCSQCPDRIAPSQYGRAIGNSLDGTYLVVVPPRDVQADPDAWYVLTASLTPDTEETAARSITETPMLETLTPPLDPDDESPLARAIRAVGEGNDDEYTSFGNAPRPLEEDTM